jgi:hypothetical protein
MVGVGFGTACPEQLPEVYIEDYFEEVPKKPKKNKFQKRLFWK